MGQVRVGEGGDGARVTVGMVAGSRGSARRPVRAGDGLWWRVRLTGR